MKERKKERREKKEREGGKEKEGGEKVWKREKERREIKYKWFTEVRVPLSLFVYV